MQRVMIVGQPGSGKSTLAQRLGAATGLPVYHLDREIHWLPGWVPRDSAEKTRIVNGLEAQDRWIIEGGHSRSFDNRIARADTLIWLDVNVWTRLWRVSKRLFTGYGVVRPDMQDGCPEVFGWHTIEFYLFIWRTRKANRVRMAALAQTPPSHVDHHVLRSFADTDRYLEGVTTEQGPLPQGRSAPL